MKAKDFIHSVFQFSIATWINFIIGLLMTVIATRFFDKETYAVINIFNTATTTGMTITCIGLDTGYIRFFNEPPVGNDQRQLVFKLMFASSGISICFGLLLLVGYYKEFSILLFSRVSLMLCVILLLSIQANLIFRFLNITYRMRFDAKGYTIQNILFLSLPRIMIIGAALFHAEDVWTLFFSTMVISLLAIIYLIVQRKNIFPTKMDLRYKGYGEVFRYSVFSAPTEIIINLNALLSNLIVKNNLGLGIAGIYSSTVTIALILNVLQGGFSTFWSGYMFANYHTAQNVSRKVHDFFVLGVFVLCLGLILCKDLIFVLVGSEFQVGKEIFPLLIIYPLLTLVLETTAYGVSIVKKSYITMLSYLSCLIVNVVLSSFFVTIWGIKGAALASSLGAFVLFIVLTEISQKYYKTITKKGRTYLTFFMIEILALTDTFWGRHMMFYSMALISMLYVGAAFRREISDILHGIKNIVEGRTSR